MPFPWASAKSPWGSGVTAYKRGALPTKAPEGPAEQVERKWRRGLGGKEEGEREKLFLYLDSLPRFSIIITSL